MSRERRTLWHKALEPAELPEGRVKTVVCGRVQVCMTHHGGRFAAFDNKCPHQGGPLGEGSIEGGMLRCPWHGWDFDPKTGRPPGGSRGQCARALYPLEVRDPTGIYVGHSRARPGTRSARSPTSWPRR